MNTTQNLPLTPETARHLAALHELVAYINEQFSTPFALPLTPAAQAEFIVMVMGRAQYLAQQPGHSVLQRVILEGNTERSDPATR